MMKARGLVVWMALASGACFSKPSFTGTTGDGGAGDAGSDAMADAEIDAAIATGTFTQISANRHHACAIDTMTRLWCWGDNSRGQLGTRSDVMSAIPELADPSTGWTSVSAGEEYTCGVRGGMALCWGRNDDGQSLPGSTADVAIGSVVNVPNGPVRKVVAGRNATCAITTAHVVQCWGAKDLITTGTTAIERLTTSQTFIDVAIAPDHACAIEDTGGGVGGTAYCWGSNAELQLGATGAARTFAGAAPIADLSLAFRSISADIQGTCATTDDRKLVCWGGASTGVLGPTITTGGSTGIVVDGTKAWTQVAMAYRHVCGIADGAVYCYGSDTTGALGSGQFAAHADLGTAVLPAAFAITVGDDFSCALEGPSTAPSGDAMCWGFNDRGQLGNRNIAIKDEPSLALDVSATGFVHQLVAGDEHTCALTGPAAGPLHAQCWGRNDKRQVTNGTGGVVATVFESPVLATTEQFSKISAGDEHNCGRLPDGTVFCWGSNAVGQLGRTTTSTNGVNAIGLQAGLGFIDIAAGGRTSCGIVEGGLLYCWGSVPTESSPQTLPQSYASTWPWTSLSIGNGFAVGLATDPTNGNKLHIVGFGNRCAIDHQDMTMADPPPTAPLDILTLDVPDYVNVQIATAQSGGGHTCIHRTRTDQPDPRITCWGMNNANQVNSATTTGCMGHEEPDQSSLIAWDDVPAGLQGLGTVATARNHSCALDSLNRLRCWGANEDHVFGALSISMPGIPVAVMGNRTWRRIATGRTHVCATDINDRQVFCWGTSKYGQLGDGSRYYPAPTRGGLITP